MKNIESGLIINTEDNVEGFVTEMKYIVIEYSDYNLDVIVSSALKYKVVEVTEIEE